MRILLKSLLCLVMAVGSFFLCRFLLIAPIFPVMLIGWGSFCFLFSYELAGSKKRIRNGVEEKTPLHLAWILVGIICLSLAGIYMFINL